MVLTLVICKVHKERSISGLGGCYFTRRYSDENLIAAAIFISAYWRIQYYVNICLIIEVIRFLFFFQNVNSVQKHIRTNSLKISKERK